MHAFKLNFLRINAASKYKGIRYIFLDFNKDLLKQNFSRLQANTLVRETFHNSANLPVAFLLKDFWSILKGKVYWNGWEITKLYQQLRILKYLREINVCTTIRPNWWFQRYNR